MFDFIKPQKVHGRYCIQSFDDRNDGLQDAQGRCDGIYIFVDVFRMPRILHEAVHSLLINSLHVPEFIVDERCRIVVAVMTGMLIFL